MARRFDLCLIGDGIGASPSGAMQEAALRAAGLTGAYSLIDVRAAELPAVLRDLRAGRWHGANVTIPYKHALATACDTLEGDAEVTGAVNTIAVESGGRLVGANTDVRGFEMGLRTNGMLPAPGSRAVVIGAGGAAAAVVLALSRVPVERITIVARRVNAARGMLDQIGAVDCECLVAIWDEDYLERHLGAADIVVNATPAGLAEMPFAPARLQASCTVADVRYRPRPVDLVAAAQDAGLRSCDGVEMLLHQGMLSFQRWTGAEAPYHAARLALNQALAR